MGSIFKIPVAPNILKAIADFILPAPADNADWMVCSTQNKVQKYDAYGNPYCADPVVPAPASPKVAPAPSVSLPPTVIYRDVYRDRYIQVNTLPATTTVVRTVYVPVPAAAPRQIPTRRLPKPGAPDTAATLTAPSKTITVRYSLDSLEYGALLHEPLSYNELQIQYCNDSRYQTEFAKRQERAATTYLEAITGVDTADPQAPPPPKKTIENLSVAFVSRYFQSFHPSTTKVTPIFGASGIAEFINNYINKNYSNFTPISTVPYNYKLENYCAGALYPTANDLVSEVFNSLILKDGLSNTDAIITQLYNRVVSLSQIITGFSSGGSDSALLEQLYDNFTNLNAFLHAIGLESINNRIVTLSQIVSGLSVGGLDTDILEQLYDNVTALSAFLHTIGLESVSNRIVTLSQIVSGFSGSGADTALLEQLYDNVTTLSAFLHTIGLESVNNRIVTLSQIVSGLSIDSSAIALLEQLYDNVTSLNTFLHTIGLESINNRIVNLSQIVSSLAATGADTELLEQLYDSFINLNVFLHTIGLESVSNRLITISQIVSNTSDSEDTALLEQLYDNLTSLNSFLRTIGLENISNRIISLAQILSELSANSEDTTLLEQLYDNLTALNTFLRTIGLENVNNRIITLSQILLEMPSGSDDNALLEQLYDNLTNLSIFLRGIGLESVNNRIVTLSQIVGQSPNNDNNTALLEQIYNNLTNLTNDFSALDNFLHQIGLESISNRIVTLSQVVVGISDNADNTALLEQIYDNLTAASRTLLEVSENVSEIETITHSTNEDVENLSNFLHGIGLEAVSNRLVTLLQIASGLSQDSDNTALLEQLYDNLANLNAFLRTIGLESINNRLVTLSQIISTSSSGGSDSALLEELYNNFTSLNAYLRSIGLEKLHNRLISIFQILSNGGVSAAEESSEILQEILRRVGSTDFPITVPSSIISTTNDLGIPNQVGTEEINSIPEFLVWSFKRMDEVLGQWSIPIEIKDTDPTTPGDQSKTMKFPNLAEAIAELLQIALQLSINSELHSSLMTRTLMETGQDKQQNFITYHLLQSLTDYVGYSYKDKILELPLLFDPKATSFDTMLTEVKVKVGVPEFDEKLNLQADLMRFRKAGSILDSVYFRKVDPNGDIKAQLLQRVFGLRDLLQDINLNSENEEFKEFLEEVEAGFTGTPGVGDATRPYGDAYEDRPRFRDLTEEQNPDI